MEKSWEQMNADEKQEAQFEKLLSMKDAAGNDINFQSAEAKEEYRARLTRIKDAIQMKKTPDRIPISIFPSMFAFLNAGITPYDAMYDYEKAVSAFKKFITEMDPDMHIGAAQAGPGRFFEMVDYKLYAWPGHGVAKEHCYQMLEGEYMKPEEYDVLINDPTYFFMRYYLPRVFGIMDGFPMLPYFPGIQEMYGVAFSFIPFGLPPVKETFNKLAAAAEEAMKWAGYMGGLNAELTSLGYANILAGYSKAPFDTLGDTLRGTRQIVMDIYRRPDKVLQAMDALVPVMIDVGVGSAMATGNPMIFMPLHKGADGMMSDEQFKKFYWPTLQKVIIGLIEGGCIPFPALEGHWDTRLDIMKDVPKGKTVWMVDQSDIRKVKDTIGKNACIAGNIPSSMLGLVPVEEVKEYTRKIIDYCAKDGGYIMCNGAFFDEAKAENVKAFIDVTKEYGVY
ncbi:MAG: uroporphyrinogen decarboxylase [Deltaproteobacteria bacterium]|nr:uroporphyrinogen decarboxylase [Deltaproteobacteria bacterium]